MPTRKIRWNRVFLVYFILAAALLAIAAFAHAPQQGVLFGLGLCLVAGFVPIIMAIYFMRGFLGSH